MASLLEDDQGGAVPDTGGLFGLPANFDIGDALGHLYSRVKTALAPEPSPLWPLDSPVGTERVGDQSVGMPDPNVSPVIGLLGGKPVTAAAQAHALNAVSLMSQFGPADVGAIRAFHGSPYDFHAFDTSKIGTGEGAQAYGYGHYAAGGEGVARYYRDTLSKWTDNVAQHVNDITGVDVSEDHLPAIRQIAMGSVPPSGSATTALKARVPELRDVDGGSMIGPHPTLENLLTAIRGDQNTGHMYELAIHADPEHMLDWDKPLSEQSGHVRDALANSWMAHPVDHAHQTGAQIYHSQSLSPEETAAALRDAGIPGIKYLDQGSRASGEGTSNYVIFDPATIEILRKYGLAGLIAGGGGVAAATQRQEQ